jgi:uncharacterized protein YjbJ (UPF0337 family)
MEVSTFMNTDQIEGKWKQVAGSFREKFGQFTNDDIAQMNGKRDQLIGKLQEKYGDTKERAEERLREWEATLDEGKQKTRTAGSARF